MKILTTSSFYSSAIAMHFNGVTIKGTLFNICIDVIDFAVTLIHQSIFPSIISKYDRIICIVLKSRYYTQLCFCTSKHISHTCHTIDLM